MAPQVDNCVQDIISGLSEVKDVISSFIRNYHEKDESVVIRARYISKEINLILNKIKTNVKFSNIYLLSNLEARESLEFIAFLFRELSSKITNIDTLQVYIFNIIEQDFLLIKFYLKCYEEEKYQSKFSLRGLDYTEERLKLTKNIGILKKRIETINETLDDLKQKKTIIEDRYSDINILKKRLDAIFKKVSIEYEHVFGENDSRHTDEKSLVYRLNSVYNDYVASLSFQKKAFKSFLDESNKKTNSILEEINGYLPGSVTIGLSRAYSEKKESESKELDENKKKFRRIVYFISLIAAIPLFFIFHEFYFEKTSLPTLLSQIPFLSACVFPILVPFVWLGIHINRNININKKLIEEYAYKEAISKTVTGLSEQVKQLNDDSVKKDIQEQLIRLIISSGENNPGQYISSHNKSDYFLLELLKGTNLISNKIKDSPIIEFISLLVSKEIEKNQNDKQKEDESKQ